MVSIRYLLVTSYASFYWREIDEQPFLGTILLRFWTYLLRMWYHKVHSSPQVKYINSVDFVTSISVVY